METLEKKQLKKESEDRQLAVNTSVASEES